MNCRICGRQDARIRLCELKTARITKRAHVDCNGHSEYRSVTVAEIDLAPDCEAYKPNAKLQVLERSDNNLQAEESMNKIEGTIVEAGRLESGEQATCGVVVWTTEKQKAEMERWESNGLVVVERKADHDAREAEVERLRDAERQRVAEGMSRWCKPPNEQAAKAGEEPIK